MDPKKVIELVQGYSEEASSDVYLFSGVISYVHASAFVDLVCARQKTKPTALLYLTTPGGDPDAAYRIIRILRARYKTVRLGVAGPCKSAGTLVALGAHELAMGDTGELGPLDVQLSKPDDLVANSSGLDIFQALSVTTQAAFGAFENYMLNLIEHSSGNISTKTAAEIAKDLAIGLYAPITNQIDPNRLGEVQRAIRIAHAYAEKLGMVNVKANAMETLVEGYPSHGFVIDFEDAQKLFKRVVRLSEIEREIAAVFHPLLRHISTETKFMDISTTFSEPAMEPKNVSTRKRKASGTSISPPTGGSKGNGRSANAKRNSSTRGKPGTRGNSNGADKAEEKKIRLASTR